MSIRALIILLFASSSVLAQAITVDGIISPEEWKSAKHQSLTGGGDCFFFQDNQNLYIGIKGIADGWSHVYLYKDNEVHVLHASAALGSILYTKDQSGKFQTSGQFVWGMRDPSLSKEAQDMRAKHLAEKGWVASINTMGNNKEIEYVIDKNKFLKGNFRIAIVYASDAKNPQYWPASLKDDCRKEQLVFGNNPRDLNFSVKEWGNLK